MAETSWAKRMTKAQVVEVWRVREEDFERLQSAASNFLHKYNFDWPLWDQDKDVEEVVEKFISVVLFGKEK